MTTAATTEAMVDVGPKDTSPDWQLMPDSIVLQVFSYLNYVDLVQASMACKSWQRVAYTEDLWKHLLFEEYKLPANTNLPEGKDSWRSEFRRLKYLVPTEENEVLDGHVDEVLHVSFSNNGRSFTSCAKDGYVKVWSTTYPISVLCSYDTGVINWTYPLFSQYNETDTLLLVAGVFGEQLASGEIAICNLINDDFYLERKFKNECDMTHGSWFSESHLLSADLDFHFGERYPSSAVVSLNLAYDDEDEMVSKKMMYRFGNQIPISISSIMLANCQKKNSPKQNVTQQAVWSDKYIICKTAASRMTSLHQVGFKKVSPFELQERERKRMKFMMPDSEDSEEEEDSQLDFDMMDNLIDLHGEIIGMALSPDHRYLYVNNRAWTEDCHRGVDPSIPKKISEDIAIHVIDMSTLTQVGVPLRDHKAYTCAENCFNIHLSVSEDYVASGSEDKQGYIWDRNYRICLAKLPHDNVVNSVAFNPKNEEMLVTASDDFHLKVWRSKHALRTLQIEPQKS